MHVIVPERAAAKGWEVSNQGGAEEQCAERGFAEVDSAQRRHGGASGEDHAEEEGGGHGYGGQRADIGLQASLADPIDDVQANVCKRFFVFA